MFILHEGSFDTEPETFAKMNDYAVKNGLNRTTMAHREIYLSDPRKVTPDKLKTVLRMFVK